MFQRLIVSNLFVIRLVSLTFVVRS